MRSRSGRFRQVFLAAAVALVLAGCVPARRIAMLGVSPAGPGGQLVSTGSGSIVSSNAAGLSGILLGPSAGIVANNAAGVLVGSGAGIVSNNAGKLVANNAASYTLRYAAEALAPLAGAEVTVTDLAGRLLSREATKTDAQGRFRIAAIGPSASVVVVEATLLLGGRTLRFMTLASAPRTNDTLDVQLDPAVTLATQKLRELARANPAVAPELNANLAGRLAAALAPAMSELALVSTLLATPEQGAAIYDAMRAVSPAVALALGAVAEQAGFEELARPAGAPPDAATSPLQVASPTPVPGVPRSSGGGGSSGSGSSGSPQPPALGDIAASVATAGHFNMARVAGEAPGGNDVGASALVARFGEISGIYVASDGTVLASDARNHHIRVIPPSGPTYVLAGLSDGSTGFNGDDRPVAETLLAAPRGLVRDEATGTVFFCDSGNHRVRSCVDGGRVATWAGGGSDSEDTVQDAREALLDQPYGLVADGAGSLYFTERGNGRVRKRTVAGVLTTLATLTPGAVGALAVSANGRFVWVADGSGVRLIDTDGLPALKPTPVFDAAGPLVTGLAFDQQDGLYVAQSAASGRADTRVWRLILGPDGQPRIDRTVDAVAGTGAAGVDSDEFEQPSVPVFSALGQRLAGAGSCTLFIDLNHLDEPTVVGGQLYLGHSYVHPTDPVRWGQVLRLTGQE